MESYIHARLSTEDRSVLEELQKATGCSASELVRRGLRLVRKDLERRQSALERAGPSAGKFSGGPDDLATNKEHLAEFGR